MTVQAIAILVTVAIFFGGILLGAIQLLLKQYQNALNQRFEALETAISEQPKEVDKVEADLKEVRLELREEVRDLEGDVKDLRSTMMREYIDHDTWVRVEGSQNAMLRKISEQLEEIKLYHARQ